jgi:hypothetical protein
MPTSAPVLGAHRFGFLRVAAATFALWAAIAVNAQSGPPPTERQQVTETFYGQSVSDPYRWLEKWQDGKGPTR